MGETKEWLKSLYRPLGGNVKPLSMDDHVFPLWHCFLLNPRICGWRWGGSMLMRVAVTTFAPPPTPTPPPPPNSKKCLPLGPVKMSEHDHEHHDHHDHSHGHGHGHRHRHDSCVMKHHDGHAATFRRTSAVVRGEKGERISPFLKPSGREVVQELHVLAKRYRERYASEMQQELLNGSPNKVGGDDGEQQGSSSSKDGDEDAVAFDIDWHEELKSSVQRRQSGEGAGGSGNGGDDGLSFLTAAYDKEKAAKLKEQNDADIAAMVANVKLTIAQRKTAKQGKVKYTRERYYSMVGRAMPSRDLKEPKGLSSLAQFASKYGEQRRQGGGSST